MAVSLDNPIGRAVQRMAASPVFATIGPKVVPHADRLLSKLSGGRFVLSQAIVPSLVLHAVGAKSGLPRDVPLATLPGDERHGDAGCFYVVGSNFGRDEHPVWTTNLVAEPEVAVTYRGTRADVRADLLDAEAKQAVWPRLTAIWPNYDRYADRSGRDLRVFRLTPR